jgi:D-beta-D-heptose 7-phosphate kinase/D-beta-D-heptose 1-phosphate adenosyltransferase
LHEAREQADVLIVALNSDASVRTLKGPERPINSLEARAHVLAGLQSVDFIVSFDDETPLRLIEEIRPEVLVKGSDYLSHEVVGARFVESYGGRLHLAPIRRGYSTTQLVQRMKAA